MKTERLTDKFRDGYTYSIKRKDMNIHGDSLIGEFPDKLGQHEDIEEKLGIDLVTLFTIDKMFFKDRNGDIHLAVQTLSTKRYSFHFNANSIVFIDDYAKVERSCLWEEYGKSFALTRKELK